MNSSIQYLHYIVRRYGYAQPLCLSLVLIAMVVLFALTIPERHRLGMAKQQTVKMKHHVIKRQLTNVNDAPGVMLNAFYGMLPRDSSLPDQLEKFFDAAFENNIYLDGIEYKLEEDKAARLNRYRITLPISGPYTNIRKFIKQVLEKAPNASLDNISLTRENIQDTDINAKLQFTLYSLPNKQ